MGGSIGIDHPSDTADSGSAPAKRQRPFVTSDGQIGQLFSGFRSDLSQLAKEGQLNSYLFQQPLDDPKAGGQLRSGFRSLIRQFVPANPFCVEWSAPEVAPLDWEPPDAADQSSVLACMFGRINLSHAKGFFDKSQQEMPGDAYRTVLLPKLSYLAHFFGIRGCPYSSRKVFSRLVWAELGLLRKLGWGCVCGTEYSPNPPRGMLLLSGRRMVHPRYWWLDPDVAERYRQLEAATPGDVLALPVTLSEPYNGYGVNAGMWEMVQTRHLPLLSAHSLMLITHGNLLAALVKGRNHGELGRKYCYPGIICAGERLRVDADKEGAASPLFRPLNTPGGTLECVPITREFNHWSGILAAVKLPKKKTGVTTGC